GKSMGLVISLMLMLTYNLVFALGTKLAGSAAISPFFGVWVGNIGFAILGAILLTRADYERENRWLNRIVSGIEWLFSKLAPVRSTRRRLSQWAYSLAHHPKFFRVLDIYV